MRRQLPLRRVEETVVSLGWDLPRFHASYAAKEVVMVSAAESAPPPGGSPPLPPASPPRGRLRTAQAAKRLGLNEKTVRRYVKRGWLRAWASRHDSPQGKRYEFDDQQLADFQREYWHLLTEQPAQQQDDVA